MSQTASPTLKGLDAGRRDRANCSDQSDVAWYTQVAFDHQSAETDPAKLAYFTGYLHGITGDK